MDTGSVDYVCAARPCQVPLPELCLKLRVADKFDIAAIVDCGAGFSYLLCSSVCSALSAWGLKTSCLCSVSQTVKLADGELRGVHQSVDLPVVLRDLHDSTVVDDIVSVRVLESVARQPFLLIGRDLIHAWDLRVFGASKVTTATGHMLFTTSPSDHLALSTEFVYDIPLSLPSRLTWSLPLLMSYACGFAGIARRSKRQFGSAESGSYGIQLRPLPDNSPKDTTLQTHYFELSIPEPKHTTVKHRPYARPLFLRLSNQYRAVYENLIQGYLSRGWWRSVKAHEVRVGGLLPAEIFLLGAKPSDVRKPRLVADFSPCNSQLPVSTTSGIAVGDVLLALRCLSPAYIVGFDCASAFYRIRLSPNRLLYMHSGTTDSNDPDYVSTRLSFGLGAGPLSMEESLGWLITLFRKSPYAVFLLLVAIFVDDGVLAGADPKVLVAAKYLFFLLDLCGFACSLPKLHFIAVDASQATESFLPLQETMALLGCELSYRKRMLVFKCCRERRLQPAKTTCAEWLEEGKDAFITKRLVFRVGGALGYDPTSVHAATSLVGDCLRRLIGKMFAQYPWDAALPMTELSADCFDAWKALLRWGIAECDLSSSCDHAIPTLSTGQNDVHLALYTDASFVGGGYVVYRLDSTASDGEEQRYLLTQAATGWKGAQYAWHSNRRELTVLLRGLRCVVNLIRNLITMSPNKSLTVALDIHSDNKPSVAWAQKSQGVFPQGIGRSTSIEKRSVLRLIDALSEEFRVLRSLGSAVSYRILHCAGADNAVADELSRYLEQCCDDNGKVTLASVLQDLPAVTLDSSGGIAEATREADRLAKDEAYLLRLADFDPDSTEGDDDVDADGVYFLALEESGVQDLRPHPLQRALCLP
ncbi:hypothetical protein FOZ60_000566 [Perkinsus olseni]|uniref:Reverse transcriptase domain-containing protein n=1 Tax=Perkinsus olseni TaxID=32597 RepID=A0A7J6MYK9_PEROL|nr:hypothetical protein FOZ60_000566 [Perkinsus olseni]